MRLGRFQGAIGFLILGASGGAAGLLWFAVAAGDPARAEAPTERTLFGEWQVFYDTQAPTPRVLLAAVALTVVFAAGVALLDRRIANRSRTSSNHRASPLAPKIVMKATQRVYAGPVTVTVLIPAHNEQGTLALTIASLLGQSHRPERVIVVADNCTDSTVAIARRAGVEVFETKGNAKKKAGALNQALKQLLPEQGDKDVVMVMDADTVLDAGFLDAAVMRFTGDRALMAVGGLFYGEEGQGLLGQFQRNEYIHYAREMRRRRGRVFVLTGTASIFRPLALRAVAAGRGRSIREPPATCTTRLPSRRTTS